MDLNSATRSGGYGPRNKLNELDLSTCSKVLITRSDLISAGVPRDWFIDFTHDIYNMPVVDTVQEENFNLRYKKQVNIYKQYSDFTV